MGISRKTLDDYFHSCKVAKVLNFDFNSNIDEKISTMRLYCKKHKKGPIMTNLEEKRTATQNFEEFLENIAISSPFATENKNCKDAAIL